MTPETLRKITEEWVPEGTVRRDVILACADAWEDDLVQSGRWKDEGLRNRKRLEAAEKFRIYAVHLPHCAVTDWPDDECVCGLTDLYRSYVALAGEKP